MILFYSGKEQLKKNIGGILHKLKRLIIDSPPAFYQAASNNTVEAKAVIAVNLEIRSVFVFNSFANTRIFRVGSWDLITS